MEKIKRFLKITGMVILIALVSVGIGITGVAPININRKDRKPDNGSKIELVEVQEKRTKVSKQKEIN